MKSSQIEQNLRDHLILTLPHHKISEVYEYATLPGGKLFRPHLVWSVVKDLNKSLYEDSVKNKLSGHALLASAVEFHHSYTLLHDDLPCMDDDIIRRGKPCTHIAYGEWKALLAGDGLLNISYQLLSKIKNDRTNELIQFFSWACGPKGLIQGQVLDLSGEMTQSFQNIYRTHELKTARLIQVAILGSCILSMPKKRNIEGKIWRYSKLLGINFQFIDDLSELCESNLSEHELKVNPWLHYSERTYQELYKNLIEFQKLSDELNLKNTNEIVQNYYKTMSNSIVEAKPTIESHLSKNEIKLEPIILLLNSFSHS